MTLYGQHHTERAWQDNPEQPDWEPADLPEGPDAALAQDYEDRFAYHDDDPSPFSGTLSEGGDDFPTIDEMAWGEE